MLLLLIGGKPKVAIFRKSHSPQLNSSQILISFLLPTSHLLPPTSHLHFHFHFHLDLLFPSHTLLYFTLLSRWIDRFFLRQARLSFVILHSFSSSALRYLTTSPPSPSSTRSCFSPQATTQDCMHTTTVSPGNQPCSSQAGPREWQ